MTMGMVNNSTTKIKGLLYFVHNIDCAVFPAVPISILKISTFPQMTTLRSSPQAEQFWSNIGKFIF